MNIIVDFTVCKSAEDMLRVLKKSLNHPEYYGNNWDARWDCLENLSLEPFFIKLKGLSTLDRRLDHQIEIMLSVFDDFKKINEQATIIVE